MAYGSYIYVEQQPVTGKPIQHAMRWPYVDVFRKNTHEILFDTNLQKKNFLCKTCNDTKHLNNFSCRIKTIENIIQSIIYRIIYH